MDPISVNKRLQEENYSLRVQITKLQVALKQASSKGHTRDSAPSPTMDQKLHGLQAEVSKLKTRNAELHNENQRLHAQIAKQRQQDGQDGQHYGHADVLTIPTTSYHSDGHSSPSMSPPEPALVLGEERRYQQQDTSISGQGREWYGRMSHGDLSFLEKEIMDLKLKLSEARSKLEVTQEQRPAGAAAVALAAAQQRQPQQAYVHRYAPQGGAGSLPVSLRHPLCTGAQQQHQPQQLSSYGEQLHAQHWPQGQGHGQGQGQDVIDLEELSPLRLDSMLEQIHTLRSHNQHVSDVTFGKGAVEQTRKAPNTGNRQAGSKQAVQGQENRGARPKKLSGSEKTTIQLLHAGMPTVLGYHRGANGGPR